MTDDARLGQLLADRFLLQEKLGEGAMGTVYLAEQQPLGRAVAVKVLSPKLGADEVAQERFVREAKALSKLSHPNVVVLHDFGTADDDSLFLVMERVKGFPLRTMMRGALPWERAARLAWGIARGLGAAHHEGVVHADLKPENVMVVQPKGEPEQVKILDFGLARLSQQEAGDTLTQTGAIMGTPRYLSPEQIQGVRDEPRSDLYALGVMLYEMVVGAPPFEAPAAAMLLVSHLSETPKAPSERGAALPTELEALILSLLAKQPEGRPANAGAVVDTLGSLLRTNGIDDGPSGPHQLPSLSIDDADQPTMADSAELSWTPRVAGAPTGEVTLVFTDIQGSSALWEAAPALMRTALERHDWLMRAALAVHGGYEVKTQGDAFMVAFDDPKAAVAWALDVQQRLMDADWDEALLEDKNAAEERSDGGELVRRGLRVRMGIYTGQPDCRPDPNTGRMDYYGPDVNRAARVEAAAQGGQVFLGGPLAEGSLDDIKGRIGDHPLTLHGEHRLKGIAEPVTIVELRAGPLASRKFPTLVTALDAATTNLGEARTHPIGRDADMLTLGEALERSRVVTLLGPGGTGKTTLARHFGRQRHATGDYAGGVWFVDLTDAVTAGGVVTSVARTLGLEGGAGSLESAIAQLGDALAARGRALLLLDNLEQVVGPAAPVIGAWLQAAEGLEVIATSRIPLALSEEKVLELGPLGGEAAVALFERQAQRALSDAEREDARTLVERLDGMPLAIELAAGRAAVLSPSQILERLDKRLDLLKGDATDRTDRQATLRGAIDWSWDLLSEEERSVFRQCGAFVGGFSLEAAEAVVASDVDVVDAIQALKSKSLLRTIHDPRGGLRFTLYETLRAYAIEQLDKVPDEQSAVFFRHADYYIAEGLRRKAAVDGPRPREALDWLSLEQENLHAVIQRFVDLDKVKAVQAGMCIDRLAEARASVDVRMQKLELLISNASESGDELLYARVLLLRGRALAVSGNATEALEDLDEVIEIADEAGAEELAFEAVAYAARSAARSMDGSQAEPYLARGEELLTRHKGTRAAVVFVGSRALRALRSGRIEAAVDGAKQAARIARRLGDRPLEARYIGNTGVFLGLSGDLVGAARQFERAKAIWEELGHAPMIAMLTGNLGVNAHSRGDLPLAAELLDAAIAGHRATGNRMLEVTDGTSRALVHIESDELDAAEPLLEVALEELVGNPGAAREYSNTLGAWGLLHLIRGDGAEAMDALTKGQAFYDSLGQAEIAGGGRSILDLAELLASAEVDHDAARESMARLDAMSAAAIRVFASFRRILRRIARDRGVELD